MNLLSKDVKTPTVDGVQLTLRPAPPFRLDLTAWVLRRRSTNSIDQVTNGAYARVFVVDGMPVGARIVQLGTSEKPKLGVTLVGGNITPRMERVLRDCFSEVLGLGVDLSDFYSMSARYPELSSIASRFRGMRPPRFPSTFETLCNAIACQQVSLNVGLLLLSRMSQKYGHRLDLSGRRMASFPTVDAVSRASRQDLRQLGFSSRKSEYLIGLARSISKGQLNLEELRRMDDQEAIEFLTQIRGVGRWSAEYTLLRGLGRLSVFPGDDVGGQNGLRRWIGLAKSPNYEEIQELLENWRGFGGLVYFHLLLKGLEEQGYLKPSGRES